MQEFSVLTRMGAMFGVFVLAALASAEDQSVVRSARNGFWSEAQTWDGEKVPGAGSKVLIKAGHTVTYDGKSTDVIRGITVAGTLAFATDKDTEINVGLIRIEGREDYSEDGFECDAHLAKQDSNKPRPTLLVG